MISKFKELYAYRDFIREYTAQQLRSRYQGTVLGFVWTLGYPLLIFLGFSLVFSAINHWELRDFGVYFFSGYIAWNFFANASQYGADSVVGAAGLVTHNYVPKAVFPIASTFLQLIDLCASMVILLLLMVAFRSNFSPALAILPVSFLILIVFGVGAALLCASINIFYRDFRHLLSAAFFMWFFFSPILWKETALGPVALRYAALNPFVPFLKLFQDPIWAGRLPSPAVFGLTILLAVATFSAGLLTFWKSEDRFYFYL